MIPEKVPRHVGIILDGNRRFAKKLMLKPWMGHEWGAKKFWQFLEWCKEIGVEEVTAYAFSVQNFDRPKEEFDYILKLFAKEAEELLTEKKLSELAKSGTRITFIGRLWMFPENIQQLMHKVMIATKNNAKHNVNLAMAYGGREEVVDAVKRIAEDAKAGVVDINKLNEEMFGKYLYLNSDPDLIIRTGGERRASNFLAWQGTYSEWFFIEKTWPELEKEDFVNIIAEYQQRERRFGK